MEEAQRAAEPDLHERRRVHPLTQRELVGRPVSLGDIETDGTGLEAPPALLTLFEDFLQWTPIAPRTPKQLAESSARLCRLLREEVTEQLRRGDPTLTGLANDWRHLLFTDDRQFAEGYSQAVTFGLLLARAQGVVA